MSDGLFDAVHNSYRERLRAMGWHQLSRPGAVYWIAPNGIYHSEADAFAFLELRRHGSPGGDGEGTGRDLAAGEG